ncbi:ECF transporter S component [Haloactinopolyspora sp.]|uniref:ECF transporter S component n=1 Tax=Haloactinopolyspora sp. TaxID=1966353 RepID=UPI0026149BFB|nr:ECF transporter S component [Haloactinopolyspora sp.]
MSRSETSASPRRRWGWRTVDIVVASVLAAAFGVLFAAWNNLVYPTISAPLASSPAAPLIAGVWLMPAVVGGLVVRKPGAALFTEVVASTISMFFGSAWGLAVFMSGVWQGLGAELVFALLFYRRWGFVPAILAGAGAGLAMGLYEATVSSIAPYAWDWKVVYVLCAVATGTVVAGVLGYVLVRALARTGALAPFAAGRTQGEI